MTRLHDVPLGQFDQFKRHLAEAGLTAEDVLAVNRRPQLARVMLGALRAKETLNQDVLNCLLARNGCAYCGHTSERHLSGCPETYSLDQRSRACKQWELGVREASEPLAGRPSLRSYVLGRWQARDLLGLPHSESERIGL